MTSHVISVCISMAVNNNKQNIIYVIQRWLHQVLFKFRYYIWLGTGGGRFCFPVV